MRNAIAKATCGAALVEEGAASQEFCFTEDFSGFSGHFPGYPILPAVVQVLLGQLVAEQANGAPLQLLSFSRAKFVKELHPGDKIRVETQLSEKNAALQARTKLFREDELAAEFIMQLENHSG